MERKVLEIDGARLRTKTEKGADLPQRHREHRALAKGGDTDGGLGTWKALRGKRSTVDS
jgi:hypothetical protein